MNWTGVDAIPSRAKTFEKRTDNREKRYQSKGKTDYSSKKRVESFDFSGENTEGKVLIRIYDPLFLAPLIGVINNREEVRFQRESCYTIKIWEFNNRYRINKVQLYIYIYIYCIDCLLHIYQSHITGLDQDRWLDPRIALDILFGDMKETILQFFKNQNGDDEIFEF